MNFFATLLVSTSLIKNFQSHEWSPLALGFLRMHSSRPVPSFLALMFPLLVLMETLSFPNTGWAWEVKTHEELTEEAINFNQGDLNAYLIDNLGLEGGLQEALPGGTPREFMKQGSSREDDLPRPLNHFHNPISNSGLALSAIKWSLRPKGDQVLGGNYSWNDAREYYFKALTSPTKAERDENWGKMFRALGQVMHLLQDSANPSHVRADTHLLIDGLHDYMARRSVASYLGGGLLSPDPSMLEQDGPAGPNGEPLANLFDRNIFTGGNPGGTLGADVGVTEYTNANFFSDDTIPGQNSTSLAYPNLPELVPASTVPFGPQYLTLPRLGSPTELKARVAKFTGNQSFSKFRLAGLQLDLLNQLQLDDLVYEAYSLNLIPRAVGYSAAVLDYFFRGELDTPESFFVVDSGFGGFGPNHEVLCDEVPVDPFGFLDPFTENPPSSLRAEGKVSYYFDHSAAGSSGTRELLFEGSFTEGEELPRPTSDDLFLQLTNFLHKEPVRWTVVIQGKLGPGEQEGQQTMNAIVAKTAVSEWKFTCDH